eukprot:gb/GECG01010676.1/.p1 GENE.gb/GECG01010676.1/~~gb/GECG01010676.1/.p1  ORF type:complete len:273 (+),score=37.32 gb/GECG01010676.1/:1-819(+)
MKYAQIVMGPAGTGKSTYCRCIQEHAANSGRSIRVINLDPAAEEFHYQVSADIRNLITVDDVMEELGYGPNGALIFCMEYLLENMDWLQDHLDTYQEDDYLLLDCPGQIELYSHVPVMPEVAKHLSDTGFYCCGVYTIDSFFASDAAKLMAGNLSALAAMMHLELSHVNVLTKCDLVDKAKIEEYLSPSGELMLRELSAATPPKFRRLNEAVARILDEYNLVVFTPLDITDEESVGNVLAYVDHALQYGEDIEPKDPQDELPDVSENLPNDV